MIHTDGNPTVANWPEDRYTLTDKGAAALERKEALTNAHRVLFAPFVTVDAFEVALRRVVDAFAEDVI